MFAQLPMYQQIGKTALNAKLDNILTFSEKLGHPERKIKTIHIAGTNGKGSSSHMLASVLQEAGYKVGLYTSPHLKDYRERIKINGKPISKIAVTKFIADNKNFLEAHKLSFFEMSVGLAFDYFNSKNVDIAIIEVGLGGRLDSTNILTPEVALITNIGYDHMDILGNTLQKIALEKAGIIKNKVTVVISERQKGVEDIFMSVAQERKSKLVFAEETVDDTYKTSLLGQYQRSNVKGVVATLRELKNFKVSEAQIRAGLLKVGKNTGLMGRWQVLQEHPMIICDTAHNLDGLQLVVNQLLQQQFNTLHIVLGFVKDKDLQAILPIFPKNAMYYFARPNVPRGLEAGLLHEMALGYGLMGASYATVMDALSMAKAQAKNSDLIFVGGSTFVVAEVV